MTDDYPLARQMEGWLEHCLADEDGAEFRRLHEEWDLPSDELTGFRPWFLATYPGGQAVIYVHRGHKTELNISPENPRHPARLIQVMVTSQNLHNADWFVGMRSLDWLGESSLTRDLLHCLNQHSEGRLSRSLQGPGGQNMFPEVREGLLKAMQ